jgi:Cu+-exporting ATPase
MRLRLGSLAWMRESGVDVEPAAPFAEEWSGRGASILGLSMGDRLVGVFALGDKVKPGAREVMEQLSGRGLAIHLITGDGQLTAHAIADQAGIPSGNVFAEIPPEDKARMVRTLQERGEKVAFVGDGINDAPALEQSDLGIAVSRASDVAREAADLVLLNSDIHAIPEALGLARSTLRTIRQNLFWAFFYNAAAVPLAALGFLHPIVCAVAMGASDIMVIGNALRLERHRP